ncbi:MAG: hypothetical protein ACTHMS_22570 [Jatrophihabitans sp.]|uniref:hypothetical protein n=1 Tax=Jatrophihabitans sp. TaxID=1932789 RepID=UPI003F7F51E6
MSDSHARRIRLVWVAAIVVVVGVLTLVGLLTGGGSSGRSGSSSTPEDVAARWTTLVLQGDTTRAGQLACPTSHAADGLGLLVVGRTTARAQRAVRVDADHWSVTVDLVGPDGSVLTAIPLSVQRIRGDLKVC